MATDKVKELAEKTKELPPVGIVLVKLAAATTPEAREAALEEGKEILKAEGLLDANGQWSKGQLMQRIVDQDWQVAQQKQEVKTAQEMYDDEVESLPAYKAVERLTEELTNAKTRLDQEKLNSPEVQTAADKLAEEKGELKMRGEILSGLLVQYTINHRVRSILVQDENHVINLTAKIGRKLKEQLELPL